ncbi:MAG: hypothetical protein ABSB74_13415 [Tepidisphaeraceae bacterium]
MSSTHLYQIFYSEQTRRELDPDFIPLDNSSNARPDWREYWPIRNFLLNNALIEDDFYGFFSPRFKAKTRLTAAQVKAFILEPGPEPDVVIFSPMWDLSSLFQNVYEQAEMCHPGTGTPMAAFFRRTRPDFNFDHWVTDSRNTIFCNYFAAKPSFWRPWLKIGEELFDLAERGEGELAEQLNAVSNYGGDVRRKVFVMERIATFLLTTENRWKAKVNNPFRFSASPSALAKFHLEAVVSDALKVAYTVQPFPEYRDAFAFLRRKIKEIVDAERDAAR